MARSAFGEAYPLHRGFDGLGNSGFVEMVAPPQPAARIDGEVAGGEHILPPPIACRVFVLALQSIRQIHLAATGAQVLFMGEAFSGQVFLQRGNHTFRQDRESIFKAFPIADGDLFHRKIHILDPQPEGLHQAQATSVEQFDDECATSRCGT